MWKGVCGFACVCVIVMVLIGTPCARSTIPGGAVISC